MKIRKKEKLNYPIYVMPDDSITLHYKDGCEDREVLSSKIRRTMTITDAVIFDVEKGEFGDKVKDGIGGAFLEE